MKKEYQLYNYDMPSELIRHNEEPTGEIIVTVEKFTIECIDEIDVKKKQQL